MICWRQHWPKLTRQTENAHDRRKNIWPKKTAKEVDPAARAFKTEQDSSLIKANAESAPTEVAAALSKAGQRLP